MDSKNHQSGALRIGYLHGMDHPASKQLQSIAVCLNIGGSRRVFCFPLAALASGKPICCRPVDQAYRPLKLLGLFDSCLGVARGPVFDEILFRGERILYCGIIGAGGAIWRRHVFRRGTAGHSLERPAVAAKVVFRTFTRRDSRPA